MIATYRVPTSTYQWTCFAVTYHSWTVASAHICREMVRLCHYTPWDGTTPQLRPHFYSTLSIGVRSVVSVYKNLMFPWSRSSAAVENRRVKHVYYLFKCPSWSLPKEWNDCSNAESSFNRGCFSSRWRQLWYKVFSLPFPIYNHSQTITHLSYNFGWPLRSCSILTGVVAFVFRSVGKHWKICRHFCTFMLVFWNGKQKRQYSNKAPFGIKNVFFPIFFFCDWIFDFPIHSWIHAIKSKPGTFVKM